MPDTELKVGDIVKMKYHTTESVQKFVITQIPTEGYVEVTWFNRELNVFTVQRLAAAAFKKS